jgi:fibro-slime domain-containing protein
MNLPRRIAGFLGLSVAVAGCGGTTDTSNVKGGGPGPISGGGSSAIQLMVGGSTGVGAGPGTGTGGSSPANQVITSLPAGYQATEIGGYKLGAAIDGAGGSMSTGGGSGGGQNGDCGNILLGVVRDFKGASEPGGHPDFEAAIAGNDVTPNLVSTTLGMDKKPVYTSKCEIGQAMRGATCPYGAQTTSQANFDQWYRDTPGVNKPYLVYIYLAPQPGGLFTFQSLHYFPLDGAGFMGLAQADDGKMHNFSFTTEIHTQFLYTGGETFTFQGDDDVWVFINNKLAVDLGGLHPRQLRNVQLDAAAAMLGVKKGTIYPLDLFHAERHTNASTFRIDTNLSFVDCGTVIPSKVK